MKPRFDGKFNGNYKHGKTLKQYYCNFPNCNRKISISSALYGKGHCEKHALKGRSHTEEHNKKISLGLIKSNRRGENHHNYKNGITPLTNEIRNSFKYKQWRRNIFQRDNFQCQECKKRCGIGIKIFLEAHHKIPFSFIFKKFLEKYKNLSPLKDKDELFKLSLSYKSFWYLKNGLTLCKQCHKSKIGEVYDYV